MKKILTASLVAIMAVTAARAEIASTDYVTTRTGDVSFADAKIATNAQNLTEAVKALDTKLGTVAGSGAGSVSDQIDGKINALNGSVAEEGKVVLTVKQENGAVTGTTGKITDAVVDSISIGKVSGLQGALDEKQTVGNMILDANASADATQNDDTRYLSAKATYTVANAVMKAKSDVLEQKVTDLAGEVDQNASDIDGLINGTNSVSAQINAAKTEINATIEKMNSTTEAGSVANKIQTVETNLGTVTSANMGTDAGTVVEAIKEVVTEAAAAQTAAGKAQGEVDLLEQTVAADKQAQAGTDSTQTENITKNANAISAMDAAYKKADADAKIAADAAYAAKSYESIVDADKAWRESIQKAEKGSVAGNYALTATVGNDGATAYKWELISR